MKTILNIFAACVLLTSLVGVVFAQPKTTYKDSAGRTTGTSTTNSSGKTTYRDAAGRTTGSATTNSSGKTTYRDAAGRTTGSSTKR